MRGIDGDAGRQRLRTVATGVDTLVGDNLVNGFHRGICVGTAKNMRIMRIVHSRVYGIKQQYGIWQYLWPQPGTKILGNTIKARTILAVEVKRDRAALEKRTRTMKPRKRKG